MIRVALNHKTHYHYDRPVELGPQVVRLRPAPHSRTNVTSYSLRVTPADHFLNWQQDPHSNYLARLVFHKPAREFKVEVDLIAEMTVINPFDFFMEPDAETYPFDYEKGLAKDLAPFLDRLDCGPKFAKLVGEFTDAREKTIDFLVELNRSVQQHVQYLIRLEPGVQTPEETLEKGSGSCRDSAWLLVQLLRHLGLAARFVSGYLIQLKPDLESLDGPSGAEEDFTDLHAWTEVFLPGAGWIGMDPTSGLLAGEGHIPLACAPQPLSAAPISGNIGECEVEFSHEMSVSRIHEDPRVTKPYTDDQWQEINQLGSHVDELLAAGDVRLTMGGEPTFVSIDDFESDEWKTAAVGPRKRELSDRLMDRLRDRFAPQGLIHYGQGKWYPGEPLPRWALTLIWRTDGQPIWKNQRLLADVKQDYGHEAADARRFSQQVAQRLQVNPDHAINAYEDTLYYLWKEQQLPVDSDVYDADLKDEEERKRLSRVVSQGLGKPIGCLLPLKHQWWNAKPRWSSGLWPVRAEQLYLLPGDSPMGLRLPLDSLPTSSAVPTSAPMTPFETVESFSEHHEMQSRLQPASLFRAGQTASSRTNPQVLESVGGSGGPTANVAELTSDDVTHEQSSNGNGVASSQSTEVIRTAMCFEPRDGRLHVFMPPLDRAESYLELLTAIEETAADLDMPVVVEGYLPPTDYRLQHIKITPDPGVIEVNVQPAENWDQLVEITEGLYEDARQSRLGTEKFDVDGAHTGTGGGNHIVMGAMKPVDSPFLRRPDLLKSLVGYWHNHPSLSYLFSGRFVGPTSQAPRVDEGRFDATYELQIAFEQIKSGNEYPAWLVDRVFRHLLVDITGNTHRAEFCIDKLYSPDSATGRLGLVEFRAFEMPPHWQMSLVQQLLLRSLVARFWDRPYESRLVDWHTSIHDRWVLPYFLESDFRDVIEETNTIGIELKPEWFEPHFEFRFPVIGELNRIGVQVKLRTAIEPWYVLGEEPAGGGTSRYVDSSVERLEVRVSGMSDDRHAVLCNGRRVPLHPTGTEGEYVAGVRYRAWQPPSCLHPTIPVDEPLVFDIVDTWMGRSIGGCKYHVGHPGGHNDDRFPVNAFEAESRRAARFFQMGHTGGNMSVPADENNPAFPMTLDLRRNRISG